MDLSEFDKTLNIMPGQVHYYDEVAKEDKTANEIELTWKHKYLPVSELKYYLREGHKAWDDMVAAREQEILEIWMKELKYSSVYFKVIDKKIIEKGKVEGEKQIENWLKPNASNVLEPTEVEEI
jgi:hypothetical protein